MLMLGSRSGSILKGILSATADGYCTLVEVGVGLARIFQHLFDLLPVLAGMPVHLSTLTAQGFFTAPTRARMLSVTLGCGFGTTGFVLNPSQCSL